MSATSGSETDIVSYSDSSESKSEISSDGSYNYNNNPGGENWVFEKIARSETYFESVPLSPVYGSSAILACAYEKRLKCIVTKWKSGKFAVYYERPNKNLVQECIDAGSAKPIHNSGKPYIIFRT